MKESYREGVALHPGPEPCEGSRKAALEALDIDASAKRSCGVRDPRHAEKPGALWARENRETPLPPADRWRAGRRRR